MEIVFFISSGYVAQKASAPPLPSPIIMQFISIILSLICQGTVAGTGRQIVVQTHILLAIALSGLESQLTTLKYKILRQSVGIKGSKRKVRQNIC
jgi:hypothetical protein